MMVTPFMHFLSLSDAGARRRSYAHSFNSTGRSVFYYRQPWGIGGVRAVLKPPQVQLLPITV